MKKVFLIFIILIIGLIVFSETKINTNNLIGYWKPNQESTQLFFWKDINGRLQAQEISGTSGEPLDILNLKINKNSVCIKTIFKPTGCATESTYAFVDNQTLECIVAGDTATTIIYTKVK